MAVPKLRFKEFDGDWFQSKIGEIFQVTSGSTPLRSDNRFFENADIAWVKTTDLNNGLIEKTEEKISQIALKETSVKILPKGTVFVAMYGGFNQIGRTGLLVHEAACNQALSAIYPNEKIDSYFLLTFLNHKVDDWKNFAASSRKDPNITKSDVLAFPLKYPVKEEQTKIASFLSAVDEKISQLTQKHQLLSQYKQGMMQKLFSQQIRFKADDGSEFEEWSNKTIGDIANIKRGASPRPITDSKWFDESSNIGWVRISDVSKSKKYLLETEQYLSPEGIQKSRLVPKGNLIMSICATIGKPIYTGFDVCIHDGFVVFSELQAIHEYAYYYLEFIEKNWYQYGQPGTQVNLNSDIVSNEEFPFPCLEEQTKIANFLSSIDQKIDVASEQLEQAKLWKKGLLQQMFV